MLPLSRFWPISLEPQPNNLRSLPTAFHLSLDNTQSYLQIEYVIYRARLTPALSGCAGQQALLASSIMPLWSLMLFVYSQRKDDPNLENNPCFILSFITHCFNHNSLLTVRHDAVVFKQSDRLIIRNKRK